MEKTLHVTEQGNLVGPFNVERSRSGYHPEVNKGPKPEDTTEGKQSLRLQGYTIPMGNVYGGTLVGACTWETVLSHTDGTCSRFDVLHKERKTIYQPSNPTIHNIWNKVWIVDAPGVDGLAQRDLVIGTNGRSENGGFSSWNFNSMKLNAMVIHNNSNNIRERASNCTYHWHSVSGPLILHNQSLTKETYLYDIRDGECRHVFRHKYPLATTEYSTPMSWILDRDIALAHDSTISLWDIESQRSFPTITFPTMLGSIRAMDMGKATNGTIFNEPRRAASNPFDGIYSTDHAVYIIDQRAKAATTFRLPLNVERVHSVFWHGDSIIIGCSMEEYSANEAIREKVLQLSITGGAKITSYTIPRSNTCTLTNPVTQVWGDNKHVLAMCNTGLHVFEQYAWKERHRIPVDDCAIIRLQSIIGPEVIQRASFHASNDRVLITSPEHAPIWCEI